MVLAACKMKYVVNRAGMMGLASVIFLVLAVVTSEVIARSAMAGPLVAQEGTAPEKAKAGAPPSAKLGLILNDPKAFRGYTVLNPMNKKTAYLIDLEGRVVTIWESEHNSMHAAYLLEDGHLFRLAQLGAESEPLAAGRGSAGRIQEFDWDGELVWDFKFHNAKQFPHHDATKMPNGNVLMVVWDKKTADEAIAAGRKKELVSDYVLPDSVVEVKPTGKTTGEVVWEWHLWDHLIQDHDSTKANYGDVAAHPELVDINFVENPMGPGPAGPPQAAAKAAAPAETRKDAAKKAEAEKLKSIGYVGSPAQRSQRINPDWTHVNAIDYNAALDQIVISVHEFSEIWIIDHSTTTAEAAGHTGGRQGKGGDLLYRWGNPRVYRAGTNADQTLFAQHNAHWIPRAFRVKGTCSFSTTAAHRPDGNYSSVDELVPPVDAQGRYELEPGKAYGPKNAAWSYSAPKKSDFFASFISGAHRLPNGNTMICSGPNGTLFEVTPQKELVWKYVNPVKGGFVPRQGQDRAARRRAERGAGRIRARHAGPLGRAKEGGRGASEDGRRHTCEVLDDEQKKKLRERSAPGPGAMGGMTVPGQIISVATQVTLKPTPEQKTQLAALQKNVDAELDKLFKEISGNNSSRCAPISPAAVRREGLGGPGGGPPAFLFSGPAGGAGVFRAYRYAPDYAGLAGQARAGKDRRRA